MLRMRSYKTCLTYFITASAVSISAAPLSADLFQVEMEFETDLFDGTFQLSAIVNGIDNPNPDKGWENFALDDAGPWELSTDNPFLTISGDNLFQAYGPTFGWGGMRLEVIDLVGPDYSNLQLDWVLSGPEWNHASISGTGTGTAIEGDTLGTLAINSWTITLIPAPGALLAFMSLPYTIRRRRR